DGERQGRGDGGQENPRLSRCFVDHVALSVHPSPAMSFDYEALDRHVDAAQERIRKLALDIHAHPELRFEEHRAAQWIAEAVAGPGVFVEKGVGGLATAVRARIGTGEGPRVAIVAEYD